ncbi:MAG: hypothetical protein ACREFT_03820 [Acetobacteraceae bacterium]
MRTSLISGLGAVMLGAVALGATSANAADQPPLTPTRDVAVTYQAKDPQGAVKVVHMNFDAAGRRLHIDVVGLPGFQVIDRKAHVLISVLYSERMYLERPLPPQVGNLMDRSPNMHMTRGTTATVAGHSCTDWSVPTGPNSPDLVACITADGVVLKAAPAGGANGGAPNLEATEIVYGPQPESLFVPPAGFKRIEPGTMPGAPGAAPGAPPQAAPQAAPPGAPQGAPPPPPAKQ